MSPLEMLAAYAVGFLVSLYLIHRFAGDWLDGDDPLFLSFLWPVCLACVSVAWFLAGLNRGVRRLARGSK